MGPTSPKNIKLMRTYHTIINYCLSVRCCSPSFINGILNVNVALQQNYFDPKFCLRGPGPYLWKYTIQDLFQQTIWMQILKITFVISHFSINASPSILYTNYCLIIFFLRYNRYGSFAISKFDSIA